MAARATTIHLSVDKPSILSQCNPQLTDTSTHALGTSVHECSMSETVHDVVNTKGSSKKQQAEEVKGAISYDVDLSVYLCLLLL